MIRNIVFFMLITLSFSAFAQKEKSDVYAFTGLDVKPEYPGGNQAFYKYINMNFRTPEVNEDIMAKVYVSFVIEKDGTMSSIKILRDPGYGMGKEAERVLLSCKEKWSPGLKNGVPVRVSYNLPITINVKSPPKEAVKKE